MFWVAHPCHRPNRSHDDFWFEDGGFDLLVRENFGTIDVQLIANEDVLAKHAHVLHTGP